MRIRGLARLLLVGAAFASVAPLVAIPAAPARAQAVDPDLFYDALAAYGSWITLDPYGEVWVPDPRPGWQPYARGRWSYVDRYGWYWESDEPWAWATYHYGGWVDTPEFGWAWAPGRVWAPAWVIWRIGDGHIGWAPAPPEGVSAPVRPGAWLFVRTADFLSGDIAAAALPAADNPRLLHHATRSGGVRIVGGTGVNSFIDRNLISRTVGYDVAPRPLPPMAPPVGFAATPFPPMGARGRLHDPQEFGALPPAPQAMPYPDAAYARPAPYYGLPDRSFVQPPMRPDERDPSMAPRSAPAARAVPNAPEANLPAHGRAPNEGLTPKPVEAAPLPPPAPAPKQASREPVATAPAASEPAAAAPPPKPAKAASAARPAPPPEAQDDAKPGRQPCTLEQAKADPDTCRPVRVIR